MKENKSKCETKILAQLFEMKIDFKNKEEKWKNKYRWIISIYLLRVALKF